MAAKRVEIEFAQRKYQASVDGDLPFFVGRKVSYQGNWGLMNTETPSPQSRYNPDAYRATYGFWADFIRPISQCESGGSFQCLNTYDRARFTFGFLQYAAHVPEGDFIKFFRELLATSPGADYFPDVTLRNGVICQETTAGPIPLETTQTTLPLQRFLNPSLSEVEEVEVIQAAKFVHWSHNDAGHREIQVRCGVNHMKKAMERYARTYSLHGALDKICLVIADIHHQGRGKKTEVFAALDPRGNEEQAYRNLLEIGEAFYQPRIATLKATIDEMVAVGVLGQRTYDATRNDFVSLTPVPPVHRAVARGGSRSRASGSGQRRPRRRKRTKGRS